MTDKVTTERRDDGVWILKLNDPVRRNAIGPEMHKCLVARIQDVQDDPGARVLVIAATGTAFCAGADLPAIFGDGDRPVDEIRRDLRGYYDCFLRLLDVPCPTIAAVHGPAIGAGLNLALCCDIRFAGPRAQFGATFVNIGLHPGGGCTFFLVRAMGSQRAMRVLLEGTMLDSQAAVDARLADEVVDDPFEAAMRLAGKIASLSPELGRDIKTAVRIAADKGFASTLEFESWAQASSATKPEIQETVSRFRESR